MKIKELREKTGLSQSKFAEYFGISVRSIQEWEQERKNPPPYLVALLERIWSHENN
jgi:putative transcriptional regulator